MATTRRDDFFFKLIVITMVEFNKDFDKEENTYLLYTVQQCYGCFRCEKGKASVTADNQLEPSPDFPKHQCSRCSVARYCNRECQKLDWKAKHKEVCAMYCQNRDGGFCVPECLFGSDIISADMFDKAMVNRREAFLKTTKMEESDRFFLTVAVIAAIGNVLRLVIAVRFADANSVPVDVNHLVYEVVDEGDEAIANISRGSGELSVEALEKVYRHTENFCIDLKTDTGGRVWSMTLGRGLVNKGDELQERLMPTIGRVMMMPSMDYVMSDMMDAAMSGFK